MTRTERLLRLARLRGDRAAMAIMSQVRPGGHRYIDIGTGRCVYRVGGKFPTCDQWATNDVHWTEAELRAAWGDR